MKRLALIGDLHYFVDGNEEVLAAQRRFFGNFMKEFFEIEADMHISLGDLTHLGVEEEFCSIYEVIRRSDVNFRQVVGNHDAYDLPKSRIQTLIGQPLNEVLETEEAVLVLLDSTRELDPADYSGTLDGAQQEWLAQQMDRSPHKPLLLFTHHPVYGTTAQSTHEKMHIDPTIDMRAILQRRHSGGFYFNGHNHVHSIAADGNWQFVQTAAAICCPSFRIVELDGTSLRTEVLLVEDPELLESARVLFDKLPRYHSPEGAMGLPSDRNQSFPLK